MHFCLEVSKPATNWYIHVSSTSRSVRANRIIIVLQLTEKQIFPFRAHTWTNIDNQSMYTDPSDFFQYG